MTIRVAVTCRLGSPNHRPRIEAMNMSENLDVYVITDSINYPPVNLNQNKIYHYKPTWWGRYLSDYIDPLNRNRLGIILSEIDPDIMINIGSSTLRFASIYTNFKPSIYVATGGECKAWGIAQGIKNRKQKWYGKTVFRMMLKKTFDHVDQVWARPCYTELLDVGLDNNKWIRFDNAPVSTKKFYRTNDSVEYRSNSSTTVIGSFCRIRGETLRTSYETLLDAAALIKDQGEEFHLVIGGIYPNSSKGKSVIQMIDEKIKSHGLENTVTKQELVPKDELVRHYSGLDIYIEPHHEEPLGGLGFASKEAMACECAFVGMGGSQSYAIEHGTNGMLVPHNDPEKVASTLQKLCGAENKIKELGNSSRQTIVQKFSYEAVSNQMEKHIRSCVTGR